MKKYQRPVTPCIDSRSALALCQEISADHQPFYIEVKPLAGENPKDCFFIIDRYVKAHGGERIIGWAIWELPLVFVEAEFHAVWLSPTGEYVDLTPRSSNTARCLFLPDPSMTYSGRQVDNIRRPISQLPEVVALLDVQERLFEIKNRGDRATQIGEIVFLGEEKREIFSAQQSATLKWFEVSRLVPAVGPYLPCPCGSGKKVKWCCV